MIGHFICVAVMPRARAAEPLDGPSAVATQRDPAGMNTKRFDRDHQNTQCPPFRLRGQALGSTRRRRPRVGSRAAEIDAATVLVRHQRRRFQRGSGVKDFLRCQRARR